MTHTDLNARALSNFGRVSFITIFVLAYAIWIGCGFAQASGAGADTVICAVLSVFISALILSNQRFDPLAPVGMLLLFTQIYFAARFSLASTRFSGWHVFVFVCYVLYLLGTLIVLQASLFSVHITEVLTKRHEPRTAGWISFLTFASLAVYTLLVLYLLRLTNDDFDPIMLVFSSLATRLAIAEQGLSPILLLTSAFSTIGMCGAFTLAQYYKKKTSLVSWLIVLALSSMVLGSRGQLVIPLLQLIIATAVCSRNYIKLLLWVGPPLTIFTVIFSTWFLSVREGGNSAPDDYSIFDRFDAYGNWLESLTLSGTQFSFGESFMNAMAQVIPRSMFPDKPYYFSTEMTRRFFNDAFQLGINLDFGGVAESFYNFHFLGPVLFGAFTGWVCRLLYQIYMKARNTSSPVLAMVYAQGLMLPPSFFFVGWINSSLVFVATGYCIFSWITVNLFCSRSEN